MTAVLDVLPNAYRSAARRVGADVATLVRLAAAQLGQSLEGTHGMAGSDDCGREWGTSYDSAASSAFAAMIEAYNALQAVGELLDQTAANYAGAETASSGTVIVGREFSAELVSSLASAPTSVGQSGVDLPAGWGIVQAFVHRAWPNGHQDRLHAAGDAWHRTCNELLDLVSEMGDAAILLREQRAPEVDAAVIVVNDLCGRLITLGNECATIGDGCHAYAHQLDEAHHRIIQALEHLAHDTVETVVVGTLFAVVTAGLGAAAAVASEATAVRNAATLIAEIIDGLLAAAVSVGAEADLAATRIAEVSDAMRPLLARKVHEAELVRSRIRGDGLLVGRVLPAADSAAYDVTSTTVPARALTELQGQFGLADRIAAGKNAPKLTGVLGQARRKFKHAPDFGITGTPTPANVQRYADAVAEFVDSDSTVTVLGTYRKAQRYLSYDRQTGMVVVRKLDGEFVSGWKMSEDQASNVYERGELGGS